MDDHLIDRINEYVDKDDILWHLGDFCFWKKSVARHIAKGYRERINCRNLYLVLGNHDLPEIRSVFDASYDYKEIKVHSRDIVLSHYAHCFWNRSHHGSWMLYGHAHGNAENWLDSNMPGRLSMDVGVDNAFRLLGEYRPFSFREISSIMEKRPGFQTDKSNFTSSKAGV
jgi:calcineurin-like phosphoesterase family protein